MSYDPAYSNFFDSQQSQGKYDERFRLFNEGHTFADRKKRLTAYVSLRLGADDTDVDDKALVEDLINLPCVVNCDGHSNTIDQVSLCIENVTLNDTEFRLDWKLRRCNRRLHDDKRPVQDDGPLGLAYKEVFNLEVADEAKHTIIVFFYGKWAHVMNNVMAMSRKSIPNGCTNRTTLSFKNIPSKCVFPYDGANVRQSDCPFCISIGNSSKLRLCEFGSMIRFDDEELEVQVTFHDPSRYFKITTATIDDSEEGFSEVTISSHQEQTTEATGLDPTCQNTSNTQNVEEPESSVSNDVVTVEKLIGTITSKRKSNEKNCYYSLTELGPISEAQKLGASSERLNVYGIVIGFGMPFITNRGDWSMSVTLVDDTKPSNEAVSLNMFLSRDSKLPALLKAGDVIRAHRVKVQEFNSRIQLICFKESSYVVIRKKEPYSDCDWLEDGEMNLSEWHVESTAKKEYTFTLADCILSRCLWKFGQFLIKNKPTILEEHKSTIASFDHGAEGVDGHFDLTALVTMVIPISAAERGPLTPRGYLRIWDGTGPPITDPLGDNAMDNNDIMFGDPSPEAIDAVAQAINKMNEDEKGDDRLEPPEALCGRVINLTVWEDTHWNFITEGRIGNNNMSPTGAVCPGQWIRLRNVSARITPFGFQGIKMTNKSVATPLPEITYEVKQLLLDHNARLKRNEPVNPNSALLPPPSFEPRQIQANNREWHGPLPALSKTGEDVFFIHQCLGKHVRESFFVRAKIINMKPELNLTFEGSLLKCCVNIAGENIFQFALTLKDETGSMDVIVPNAVAEELLEVKAESVIESIDIRQQCMHHFSEVILRHDLWEARVKKRLICNECFFFLDEISPFEITQTV